MRFRPELVVSALSAISVIVILLDFLSVLDDSAKIAVYAFDAIVVVGVFLMITGVATFAMVTSRLAAAFLHSKSKKDGDSDTPLSLDDQTRALLKQKIDHVGDLSERELDTLTAMIKALWQAENKKGP